MDMLSSLKTFNRIYKEMDTIHHGYAKSCGFSDMAYWILYSMAEEGKYFTQRDFCNAWFIAPQTVNSALKDLLERDIIYLEPVCGNKKNKLIKPTESGKKFIEEVIAPIINAECESFKALTEEQCELMLSATQKYVSVLKERAAALAENTSAKE